MQTGWRRLEEELARQRQKGYTATHDDGHDPAEFWAAAAAYAGATGPEAPPPSGWPWDAAAWRPRDERANLVRGGALFLAGAERAERAGERVLAESFYAEAARCAERVGSLGASGPS